MSQLYDLTTLERAKGQYLDRKVDHFGPAAGKEHSMSEAEINESDVEVLAQFAKLPLPAGRGKALVPTLVVWLRGIDELNRKMAAQEHLSTAPIVAFHHLRRP